MPSQRQTHRMEGEGVGRSLLEDAGVALIGRAGILAFSRRLYARVLRQFGPENILKALDRMGEIPGKPQGGRELRALRPAGWSAGIRRGQLRGR